MPLRNSLPVSRIHSRLGFMLCVLGAVGAAHHRSGRLPLVSLTQAVQSSPATQITIATRAFDLSKISVNDFGDLEPASQ